MKICTLYQDLSAGAATTGRQALVAESSCMTALQTMIKISIAPPSVAQQVNLR